MPAMWQSKIQTAPALRIEEEARGRAKSNGSQESARRERTAQLKGTNGSDYLTTIRGALPQKR